MNLIDNTPNKPNNKWNKVVVFIVILMVILIVTAGVLYYIINEKQKNELKFYLDGDSKTISSGLFFIEDDKVYTNIKDIAYLLSYQTFPGIYKENNENDISNCYVIDGSNSEISQFETNSSIITKYSVLDTGTPSQKFDVKDDVILIEGKMYANVDAIKRAFNVLMQYDKDTKSITIQSMLYLVRTCSKKIPTNALNDFSDNIKFANQKALLKGFIILKNPNNNYYGVAELYNKETGKLNSYLTADSDTLNSNQKLFISERYKQIEFDEGTENFIVTNESSKVGIFDNKAQQLISPEYDSIQNIDKDRGLFVVSKNGLYGIVNNSGNVLISTDFNQIGLSNSNYDKNISNNYILLDAIIPVVKDGLWYLYDLEGKLQENKNPEVTRNNYDFIGCNYSNSKISNTSGVVVVPKLNSIVVGESQKDDSGRSTTRYALVSATNGQQYCPFRFNEIYTQTANNVTTYLGDWDGTTHDLVQFITQANALPTDTNTKDKNEIDEKAASVNSTVTSTSSKTSSDVVEKNNISNNSNTNKSTVEE